MLKNIKAVIFDLDGTLVDSMWVWKQIDIDYLSSKNKEMPQNLQRQIEGMSMVETARFFKRTFEIDDTEETMMNTWNQMAMDVYTNQVEYKPGAEQFLQLLRKKKIKTGIATSNSKELLHAVAVSLNMKDYIDCFLTGNEVLHGKPSPDIYLEVAKRLQVQPSQCLVFEDIIPGIMAGKNARMKVCAIEDEYSLDQSAEKQKVADYYIKDFIHLLREFE